MKKLKLNKIFKIELGDHIDDNNSCSIHQIHNKKKRKQIIKIIDNKPRPKSMLQVQKYTICMIGPCEVGKSIILLKYRKDEFDEEYIPTSSDSIYKPIKIGVENNEERRVDLEIFDTGGDDGYEEMNKILFKGKDAYVLVFDLTDIESINYITKAHQTILKTNNIDKYTGIVCGNKRDLINIIDKKTLKKTRDKARNLAESLGIPYCEVSAKTGIGIDSMFTKLSQLIRFHYKTKYNALQKFKTIQQIVHNKNRVNNLAKTIEKDAILSGTIKMNKKSRDNLKSDIRNFDKFKKEKEKEFKNHKTTLNSPKHKSLGHYKKNQKQNNFNGSLSFKKRSSFSDSFRNLLKSFKKNKTKKRRFTLFSFKKK